MKLEDQVPDRKLCKKLREVGYPREGLFWWYEDVYNDDETKDVCEIRLFSESDKKYANEDMNQEISYFVAPTIAEMTDLLPSLFVHGDKSHYWHLVFQKKFSINSESFYWYIGYWKNNTHHGADVEIVYRESDKLADASAKMLIYLAENKLIKFK